MSFEDGRDRSVRSPETVPPRDLTKKLPAPGQVSRRASQTRLTIAAIFAEVRKQNGTDGGGSQG